MSSFTIDRNGEQWAVQWNSSVAMDYAKSYILNIVFDQLKCLDVGIGYTVTGKEGWYIQWINSDAWFQMRVFDDQDRFIRSLFRLTHEHKINSIVFRTLNYAEQFIEEMDKILTFTRLKYT